MERFPGNLDQLHPKYIIFKGHMPGKLLSHPICTNLRDYSFEHLRHYQSEKNYFYSNDHIESPSLPTALTIKPNFKLIFLKHVVKPLYYTCLFKSLVFDPQSKTHKYMSDILLRYVEQTRSNYLMGKWVFFTSSQSDVHFFFPFSFSFRWQGHATFAGELP